MSHVWITAYDVFSAQIAQKAGVDTILVGDSLGMTVYGMTDTRGVSVEMMLRHAQAVRIGAPQSTIVVDFPFGTTDDVLTAVETAEVFSNAGFTIFKIEGGKEQIPIIMELCSRGFDVVGHLGLTPQTIVNWGLQGNTTHKAQEIYTAIERFAVLGIRNIVLECVPEKVGTKAQNIFSQNTQGVGNIIGIGAGRYVNGQVLVFDDVVGRTSDNFNPKFLKRYGKTSQESLKSVQNFVKEVQEQVFPVQKNVYG